jgi:hypothetical protein
MKSSTSPTPSAVMNRVIRMAVSGKYSCLTTQSSFSGAIRKCPPRSRSSSEPNTLGESNRGQHHQSTVPSVLTNAAVCRFPINPWSAIVG